MSSDRPFAIYADGDPIGATPAIDARGAALPERHRAGLMFRARARPRPRSPRAASRRVGRSGGTTAPGRAAAAALARARSRRMARRARRAARCSSPPPTARPPPPPMLAAALERAGRAGRAQPRRARTWPGAWPPRCSTPGASAGELGLFEVDEAWLPAVARRRSTRGCCCSSNLFRDQLDRYGELELLADRWAELVGRAATAAPRFVLNADDPLVADLGRERERRDVYFGVEDDSQALPEHAARRRLEALPQLRPRLRLRGRLPRPHGPLPLPELRPHAARARRSRPRSVTLDGMRGSTRGAAHARRADSSCELQLPGLYNVYNARRRRRDRARAGRAARRRSARRSRASAARSGASRRSRSTGRAGVDPAGQEPGRRERGAAHADARGRRSSTCGSR